MSDQRSPHFPVTRALSLTQPWATLVAVRAKRHETRCWPTAYRGWIAIHAAKGFPRDCQALCAQEPFASGLWTTDGPRKVDTLPRGKVIAVARLTHCIATAHWAPAPDSAEYAFGDYSPIDASNGKPRYSFQLDDVRQLRKPFDCKGSLGIWRLPEPITEEQLL